MTCLMCLQTAACVRGKVGRAQGLDLEPVRMDLLAVVKPGVYAITITLFMSLNPMHPTQFMFPGLKLAEVWQKQIRGGLIKLQIFFSLQAVGADGGGRGGAGVSCLSR